MDSNLPAALPDFRALFEAAPGCYLVLAIDWTIVAVSDAYLRATMTRRAEILGRGLFDVFPDNPRDPSASGETNLRASLERVVKEGLPDTMAVQKYDIRKPESEGGAFEVRHWSPVNTPVFVDGRVAYVIHRVEDVTDYVALKQQERQRGELAEALRSRAADMEAEIFRRAQDIQEANRKLRTLQTELEQRVADRTKALVAANEKLQSEIDERERVEGALRKSEAQLRHAQKLEAVGRLAAGVAHDFNNLLSVVISYSDLALDELPESNCVREGIAEIKKAGERAAGLTRQLLAFSRQQMLEPRSLRLDGIVRDLEKMFRRVIGEDIDLAVVIAADLGSVRADPTQIEQILMNLVINARDAMPTGGKLTIELENATLSGEHERAHFEASAGEYVLLAVSDTGIGMDEATRSRIFEPFFTNKAPGRGTGLGLSTVYGSVRQSGGHVWVYSEPGRGSTFRVYLPREPSGEARVDAHPPAPFAASAAGGHESILLTEDEPQVRAVVAGILRRAGYVVIEAEGPAAALAASEAFPGEIHLLLTDVVMPQMSGVQLAKQLRSARPSTQVLCMSGYTDEAVLRHGVIESGIAFVQKPITPDRLLHKVRQILSSSDGARVG